MQWGILGPADILPTRRTRTLGLAGIIRAYNEYAAPGMGNIWFGKQLLLALLGIELAENLRNHNKSDTNINCANAVEALACLLIYDETGFAPNDRLQGRLKLQHKDSSFKKLSSPNGYVTQPMRMATVQPLRVLGLVETDGGQLFNRYRVSEFGKTWIKASQMNKNSLSNKLCNWALNDQQRYNALSKYLDPTATLNSRAANMLLGRLVESSEDRANLFKWLSQSPNKIEASAIEKASLYPRHLEYIQDGAKFVAMRDAATDVLDCIEGIIRQSNNNMSIEALCKMDGPIESIEILRNQAGQYVGADRLEQDSKLAANFKKLCLEKNPGTLIQGLVKLDGLILRLDDQNIVAGENIKSFENRDSSNDDAQNSEEEEEEDDMKDVQWPDFYSPRLSNFHNLIIDLNKAAKP